MKSFLIKTFLGFAGQLLFGVLGRLADGKIFDKAIQLAITQVARLDGETMDEKAKREAAYAAVKAELQRQGQALRDSILNLAIELAVSARRSGVK